MSLSSITISGTLRKDPEKRFTPTNIPVTNLMLEVTFFPRNSQSMQDKGLSVQIVRVNAWRDLAEECEKKLKTQDKILVSGRAQINAYTTNEGKKKREIEIDATSITLLQDVLSIEPPVSQEQVEKVQISQKKFSQDTEPIKNFEEVVTNTEEIPF